MEMFLRHNNVNLHVVDIMKKNWNTLKKRNIVRSEIEAPMGRNTACDISIVCEAIWEN